MMHSTDHPLNLKVPALREHAICGIQMYSNICGTRHDVRRGCRTRVMVTNGKMLIMRRRLGSDI